MKSNSLIKMIEKDGWFIVRTNGSHHVFKHNQNQVSLLFLIRRRMYQLARQNPF